MGDNSGIFQYMLWGTAGPTLPLGVRSGGDIGNDPDLRVRPGAGGTEHRRGGLVKFAANSTFYLTSTNWPLVQLAKRSAYPRGALTQFYLEGGDDGWGVTYTGVIANTLRLGFNAGEGITAAMELMALTGVKTAGGAELEEANQDFEDYECVASVEATEYGVSAWELSINNNYTARTAADTKVTGRKRWPLGWIYGAEELNLSLTTQRPIAAATTDLFGDLLPDTLAAVLAAGNGTDVLNIALADLIPGGPEGFATQANEAQNEWSYAFRGDAFNGSTTWSLA